MSRSSKRKRAERRADRCLSCNEPHHVWEASAFIVDDLRKRSGLTSPLHDAVIGDAAFHLLIDSYRVQSMTGDREIEEIITVIGTAIGFMVAAATERGVVQGRDEGLHRFFKALVDEMGPGRYEIEVGPKGEPVGPAVLH